MTENARKMMVHNDEHDKNDENEEKKDDTTIMPKLRK